MGSKIQNACAYIPVQPSALQLHHALFYYLTKSKAEASNSASFHYYVPQRRQTFHYLSSRKNLIIKILKQQTTETHSRVAPQSVSETLAREHPERVRGAKHMRQLYSSQNLLLSTATFSPGAGTDQGKKRRLQMQQQQQTGPARRGQRAERAGLELGPSQGEPKAQGSGQRRWGHRRSPNLQTHDL